MNATKHMMFSYRMIVPFVPAAGVVLLELCALARGAGTRPARRGLLAVGLAAMLAVQALTAWQIDRVSINPGYVGEYLRWSRRSYVEGFANVLENAAGAIRRHWQEQPDSAVRPPRIYTFAAGITPYYLPEATVYEQLVSYRHGGLVDWDRLPAAADYRIVATEPDAPVPERDGDPQGRLLPVARYRYEFDGRWVELQVLFNRRPRPYRLPRFVDGTDL